MPWDATRLHVAAFAPDGTLGEATLAAGGPDESIVQPEWSPDGTLHLISDRSGWWNLYRLVEGPRLEPIAAMEAEFADAGLDLRPLDVRVPGRRRDRRDLPARRSGPPRPDRTGSSPRRGRHPVHRARLAAGHAGRRSPPSPAVPATRRSSPGSTRSRSRPPACCVARARSPSIRRRSATPNRSSSRRPATEPRSRSTTHRRTRRTSAPTGRSRRCSSSRTAVRPRTP